MSILRTSALFSATVILAATLALADAKSAQSNNKRPMEKETRMLVIRSLNAELVFVRTPFPVGQKGLTIKNGEITPGGQDLQMLIAQHGMAAKPGDRARITNIEIKKDRIRLEINGGPKKKRKWYQRIQVSGMGGTVPVAPNTDNPNPKGSFVDLVFEDYVPEMTGDQIRDMLSPVLDFHAKSAIEAYLDTVPPKVKEAVKNHKVLVGMNREMVTYAKGRPKQKIREKDEQGIDYEEWIYGEPPQDVTFVRFVGDEVVRLAEMKVDGTKMVRTEKEVDIKPDRVELAEKQAQTPKKPARAPTLVRPGEKPEIDTNPTSLPGRHPGQPPPNQVPPDSPTPSPSGVPPQ
ncbi:MAG TPA: hypothetical protein VD837_08700 [Terriglobales bacterium]|nr:hypothetical protein [Terriglobales bacterium]